MNVPRLFQILVIAGVFATAASASDDVLTSAQLAPVNVFSQQPTLPKPTPAATTQEANHRRS